MKKNYKKHLNKIAVLALTMVLCLSNMGPSFAYIGELSGNPEKTETTEKHELYAEGEAIVCCVDYSNVDGQSLKNEIKLIENELDEPKTEETDLSDLNALLKNSDELMDLGKKPVKQFKSIDKGILNIKSKSAGKASKILKHVVNEDMTTEELVEKLEELPNVEYAEPNYYRVPMFDVDNYDWTDYQWAYNGYSSYGMNIPNWNVSGNANAEGVVVAVMDTGVNYNNPDLKNIMWDDGESYPTLTALGGGKYGINTAGTTGAAKKDPMDNQSHGTHCAGIIGAQWNGKGVSGAGNGVEIMGVKAYGTLGFSDADLVNGFAYIKAAKEANVNVVAVNNSWGSPGATSKSQDICDAITSLNDVGVICVFAAGNENHDCDPYYDWYYDEDYENWFHGYFDAYFYHDLPNTIIVGSNGMSGNRASYSNWGKTKVDVFAPGGDSSDYSLYGSPGAYVNDAPFYWGAILSTVSKGTANYPENYGTMQGTSMACPAVTGAVAILRAQYPEATAGAIIEAVKDGVTEGKTDIKQKCVAEGYVNVEKSLEILAAAYSASEDAESFASITSTNDGFEDQTVTLFASAEAGITAYYWGTDASGDPQETSGISADGTLNTTKIVSADGKYYLIAKDASDNCVSESMEFYKTTFAASNATVSPAYVIVEAGKSYNLPEYTAISANEGYIAPTTNTDLWKKSGSNAINGGSSFTPNGSFTLNLNLPCKEVIAKPTADTHTFTYTGSEHTYNPVGFDSATMDISGNTQTNAGTYTVEVTPKDNYAWSTSDDCKFQWIIAKATNRITAPADQTWNATFSSDAQTKTLNGFTSADGTVTYSISGEANGFTISGTTLTMPAKKAVGTYTLTIKGEAAGTDNYNSKTSTFKVTVTVAKLSIAKPTENTSTFTYNGNAQTYTPANFDASKMDISGNTQTNAGTYTVEVTPKSNYTWSGPCTFEWTIQKANKTISAEAQTFTYGDTGKSVVASVSDGATLKYTALSGDSVSVNATTGALTINHIGDTEIKISADATTNYNAATKTITVKIAAATLAKPAENTSTFTYNGNVQTYTPVNFDASKMDISGNTATNAGSYEVTVTPKENYAWNGGGSCTFEWTIQKANKTISAESIQTFTYGDTGKLVLASVSDGATLKYTVESGNSVSVSATTGALTINHAGESEIKISATETDNYTETVKIVTIKIKAKEITKPTENTDIFTYTGSEQTYNPVGFDSTTMDISGNTQTNAGTYTVEVFPKDNYAWSISSDCKFEWVIAKATNRITAPADQTWNVTFSSDAQTKSLTGFSSADGNVTYSISGEASGFTILGTTLTMPANRETGTYTLKIQGDASGTSNYKSGTATFNVTVNVARGSQTITADDTQTFTFGDTDKKVSADAEGTLSYSRVSGNSVSVNANTGALTINSIGDTVIKITAAQTTNYNSVSKNITVHIDKKTIARPTANTDNFTYTGSEQTYTPVGFDANTMDISGNTQRNAGTYLVEVFPKDDYAWSTLGDCEFNWVIAKATQTITAADPQSFVINTSGNSVIASAQGTLHYSVVSGNSVSVNETTGALTISSIGNTVIKISADATENYNAASKNITVIIATATSQVTFETNGGICDSLPTTYAEGIETTLPTDITREGYTFDGWYDNAEYLGEPVTEISAGATGDLEFWAKWTANTYTITNATPQISSASSNGYIDISSEASCGSDVIVTIHANSEYVLDTLKYILDGGTETTISISGSVYKFTMPAENVTVKATFKEETTSGGGVPSEDTPTSESGPINANINIGTETDSIDVTVENGVAKIGEISKSDLEDAAKNNDKTKSKAIVIDLSQGGSLESVELTTSTVINILDVLKSNKNAFNTFEIQLIDATLSFNTKAVESVKKQSKGSTIDFAVVKITPSNLNDTQKEKLMKKEVGLVFNATIESGGSSIHTFNGGKAFVGIKFTVPAGKKAENAKAYYIDNKGKMQKMATKCVDGNLMFATPHFSDFAIVFEDKPESVTLKAKASGKRAIKLSWNSIGGAEKYVVYGAKKGKALKKIKTLKSKSYKATKASGSKLKSRSTYKFYVVAYDALGQKFKSKTISKKAR